ncbi:TetR/AcrR family transcriptional regulator [uncultured Abyssibacter sp.]|uniref:TetR/AcrR family transcriptional regulator n=1 Tax=uncultured Abyssibacter sp. TaxID=2320202 RepID=UPI0032B18F74
MYREIDGAPAARKPSQARSRERVEKVVAGADALLAEGGLERFSIPTLAERLGMSRRSIYLFFPTPYDLLNEVTRRYIARLEDHLAQRLTELGKPDMTEMLARMTFAAADFHNRNPVGRLLILGGAVTDNSYKAQDMNKRHLGSLARNILLEYGFVMPESPPDVATIAVEMGTACYRHSYGSHGLITDDYKVESAYVMLLYLNHTLGIDQTVTRDDLRRFLQLPDVR